jgi:hypothetical protein
VQKILDGPGTLHSITYVFKEFRYTKRERTYAEFRAEFFDVANTPQFNNPASAIGNPPAGRSPRRAPSQRCSRRSRQVKLALKFFF